MICRFVDYLIKTLQVKNEELNDQLPLTNYLVWLNYIFALLVSILEPIVDFLLVCTFILVLKFFAKYCSMLLQGEYSIAYFSSVCLPIVCLCVRFILINRMYVPEVEVKNSLESKTQQQTEQKKADVTHDKRESGQSERCYSKGFKLNKYVVYALWAFNYGYEHC